MQPFIPKLPFDIGLVAQSSTPMRTTSSANPRVRPFCHAPPFNILAAIKWCTVLQHHIYWWASKHGQAPSISVNWACV